MSPYKIEFAVICLTLLVLVTNLHKFVAPVFNFGSPQLFR